MKYKQARASERSFDFTDAIDFIKNQEGFSADPYWDNKRWSWGYGTAAGYDKNNKPPGTISMGQAEQDLLDYVKGSYIKITMALNSPLSHNQMTALLDFDYNEGFGSTLKIIKNINNGYTAQQTADEMNEYVYSGGLLNNDLVKRRQDEARLYLS